MIDSPSRPAQQRGVALLMTLLVLALLIAAVAELSTQTAVDSIRVSRRANALQHELAVDSTLVVVQARLGADDQLIADLDRFGRATLETTLGPCDVRCVITDDAAKLDVAALDRSAQARLLQRKLAALQRVYDLPPARVRLRPTADSEDETSPAFVWFDQLFADAPPMAFVPLGIEGDPAAPLGATWSDVLTLFGSGRIDVRRVDPRLLDVALADLGRGLGRKIVAGRDAAHPERDFLAEALARLDDDIRDRVAERLAFDLRRYALTIETAIGGDRRTWYVVATIGGHQMTVHYRGQIRW